MCHGICTINLQTSTWLRESITDYNQSEIANWWHVIFCSFELVSRKHSKTFTRERNKRHRNKHINNRRKISTNKQWGGATRMNTHTHQEAFCIAFYCYPLYVGFNASQSKLSNFVQKLCEIQTSIALFEFSMKNVFKYVQTSMVLFHCSWESFSILWKYIQILTLYYIQCVTQ